MLTYFEILESQDLQEEHSDHNYLMEEYSQTEIFKEVIHFMDLAFPEWNSNLGIGSWAAEFVFAAIQNLEYLNEETRYTSFMILRDIYMSLVADYEIAKARYKFTTRDSILNDFEMEYRVFLEENEHLSQNDFNALYDELYNNYSQEILSKKTYYFFN